MLSDEPSERIFPNPFDNDFTRKKAPDTGTTTASEESSKMEVVLSVNRLSFTRAANQTGGKKYVHQWIDSETFFRTPASNNRGIS